MKKINYWFGLGAMLLLAAGCQKDDDENSPSGEDGQNPIEFACELDDDANATRATLGLYSYHKTFKINGVKKVNNVEKNVMSSYGVQYLDGKAYWEYVSPSQSTYSNQIEKYWDYDATEYHFIAGAPYSRTTINSSTSLTVDTLKMASITGTANPSTSYLFSEPKKVVKADYNKSVMMTFHFAMARIKFAFYYAEAQTDPVNLSNMTFGPTSGSFVTQGKLTINYDFTSTTPSYTQSVTIIKTQSTPLAITSIDLEVPCTTQTSAGNMYYVVPLSSDATPVPWTLTIGSFTENNTATVPAEYMKWQPGHEYVYVFKLGSAATDPTIKFINCVQTAITGWDTGETMTPEVYNW